MLPPLSLMGFLWALVIAFAFGVGWSAGCWLVNRLLR
jgi:hypothetical protein